MTLPGMSFWVSTHTTPGRAWASLTCRWTAPGPGHTGCARRCRSTFRPRYTSSGYWPVPSHLLLHVQPVDPAAHLPVVGGGLRQLPLPENLSRQQDAVDDLHIAGAAADVVADGEGRLLPGGIGIHVQQPLGGDHHAGDAEAALDGPRLAEGEGVDLLFPIGQALHREDGLAPPACRSGGCRPWWACRRSARGRCRRRPRCTRP